MLCVLIVSQCFCSFSVDIGLTFCPESTNTLSISCYFSKTQDEIQLYYDSLIASSSFWAGLELSMRHPPVTARCDFVHSCVCCTRLEDLTACCCYMNMLRQPAFCDMKGHFSVLFSCLYAVFSQKPRSNDLWCVLFGGSRTSSNCTLRD